MWKVSVFQSSSIRWPSIRARRTCGNTFHYLADVKYLLMFVFMQHILVLMITLIDWWQADALSNNKQHTVEVKLFDRPYTLYSRRYVDELFSVFRVIVVKLLQQDLLLGLLWLGRRKGIPPPPTCYMQILSLCLKSDSIVWKSAHKTSMHNCVCVRVCVNF